MATHQMEPFTVLSVAAKDSIGKLPQFTRIKCQWIGNYFSRGCVHDDIGQGRAGRFDETCDMLAMLSSIRTGVKLNVV